MSTQLTDIDLESNRFVLCPKEKREEYCRLYDLLDSGETLDQYRFWSFIHETFPQEINNRLIAGFKSKTQPGVYIIRETTNAQ